jgi:excisionase family DNA binding protein
MPLAMAARYLSLDENSFLLVTAEARIGTVDMGLELERWRKSDLDRLLRRWPIRVPERAGKDDKPQPAFTEEMRIRLIQKVQTMAPKVQPEAYGILDAARITGLSRSTLYKLMTSGEIRPVRVGGRTLIKRCDLQRLLNGASAFDGLQVEPAS